MTGNGRIIVRYRQEIGIKIRLLEAFECMRLIGWDDTCWLCPPSSNPTDETLELLEDMAGNAYTIWHYVPWMLALLATFGKFSTSMPDANSGSALAFEVPSSPREVSSIDFDEAVD